MIEQETGIVEQEESAKSTPNRSQPQLDSNNVPFRSRAISLGSPPPFNFTFPFPPNPLSFFSPSPPTQSPASDLPSTPRTRESRSMTVSDSTPKVLQLERSLFSQTNYNFNEHSPYPTLPEEQQQFIKDAIGHLMSMLAYGGCQSNSRSSFPLLFRPESTGIRRKYFIILFLFPPS